MHNGLAVTAQGYYGAFSDILTANRGVHEPAEERLFAAVLAQIDPSRAALMVELGSYWAYYSTWFSKAMAYTTTTRSSDGTTYIVSFGRYGTT